MNIAESSVNNVLFMNKPVVDMAREELLDVIGHLVRELETERDSHRHTLDMWEFCRKARVTNKKGD